jgi:hypothetical protein
MAIPPRLAVYTPSDWDGDGLAGEAALICAGFPVTEERLERLRRSRWLEARAEWAQVNAPAAWPDLLAEFLGFPV